VSKIKTNQSVKKEIQQSTHSLSLRFLSDGSIKLKKGSTTIHKIGTVAEVRGRLVKDFTEDVVLNINLVQKTFSSWLREYQDLYNSEISLRSSSITSIKYKRLQVSLVEETLPVKPVSLDSFELKGQVFSRSVPSPKKFLQLREYSTTTEKSSPSPSPSRSPSPSATPSIIVGISLEGERERAEESGIIPGGLIAISTKDSVRKSSYRCGKVTYEYIVSNKSPVIKLVRDRSGSYTLSGLDGVNLLHSQRLREILKSISSVSEELESINARGYVNSTKLSDFPVLSGYLKEYVKPKAGAKGENSLNQLDSCLTLREKRVLVGWFHTLFSLNMYTEIYEVLTLLGVGISHKELSKMLETSNLSGSEKEIVHDQILDLQTYARQFYGSINPSIREALRQRGLTLSENTYCGFDTEFQHLEMGTNKILSAQWAVSKGMVLTLPYLLDYELSNQNVGTGESFSINKMWFEQDKIAFDSLQSDLRVYIRRVRSIRFSSNDESLKRLTLGLIEDGVPYFISDGKINFRMGKTNIKTYFKTTGLDKLDLSALVRIGLNMVDLEAYRRHLLSILKDFHTTDNPSKVSYSDLPQSAYEGIKGLEGKKIEEVLDSSVESKSPPYYKGASSRTYKGGFTSEPISLTTRRNFYVIGHLTQADLSLLSDFDEFKRDLDIVNKCMVTLGRSSIVKHGHNIIFRDTLLLAPGGKKSLASIGSIYGPHLGKINLSESQHQNMELLLKEDPNLFKAYALRDSLISLVHACVLEDWHFRLNKLGIPLTLSSLGVSNLRAFWKKEGYEGYQISKDYLLGDSRKMPTPRGLFSVGDVGLFMNNYIANYKGGRNESFMIGHDTKRDWYDYDLTAAYTTAMSMLGDPAYNFSRRISPEEIRSMTDFELLYSYTTVEVKQFKFPSSVRYPSIPCNADEITTVYPLTGKAVLTGIEYLTALKQGCVMDITGGTLIPFRLRECDPPDQDSFTDVGREVRLLEGDSQDQDSFSDAGRESWLLEWDAYKSKAFAPLVLRDKALPSLFKGMPFRGIICDLQSERCKHEKGTISNLLYKEMGNALYGSVSKGINHKVKYDIKTGRTVRMESNDISNAIISSWITAYIRSLLGELLQKVSDFGGKVVSVTTDGFITDIACLESRVIASLPPSPKDISLLTEYRKARELLSGDPVSLELKNEKRGLNNLMSWTTRGQLSTDMGIKSMTGLQTHGLTLPETWDLMSSAGLGKTISFASTTLRSAIEIYKKGGHVSMSYRDQDFRVYYNNNRIIEEPGIDGFFNSRPVKSVEEALTQRRYSQITRGTAYQRNTSLRSNNKYSSNLEIGIRGFLKAVLSGEHGLSLNSFTGYRDLIDFVHKFVFSSGYKLRRAIDSSYVSQLKMRIKGKIRKPYQVPRLPGIIAFYDYVKERYPSFDPSLILSKVS
jgi:hypothetical protein